MQGRKQVILLSSGFDSSVLGWRAGQEAQDASRAVTEGRLWDVQSERYFGDSAARDALDHCGTLAASDTVVHSVDVTGLAAGGAVDEAAPGRIAQGRDTLAQLASNSGGRLIKDANDLSAGLGEVLAASRYFYVRRLRAVRPGKEARSPAQAQGPREARRAGAVVPPRIRDPRPEARGPARRHATLQAAEAITKGLSGGPIGLKALALPYRDAKGRVSIPVVLEVDGRACSKVAPRSRRCRSEIYGYALDGAGQIRDAFGLTPVLDLAAVKPALLAKGLPVISSFAAPQGKADLRFVVRDKAPR